MTKSKPKAEPPAVVFEEALERLEKIVADLEEGQIGLSQSLARYEEGIALLKQCHGLLEGAELRIAQLSGFDSDGNPLTEPFEDDPAPSLGKKAQARGRRRSRRSKSSTGEVEVDDTAGLF